MALTVIDAIRHTVRLHGDEDVLPGEYTVEDGAAVTRRPTDVPCPYCQAPMTHLDTAGALRVAKPVGERCMGAQEVLAHRVPQGARVLKCGDCNALFCEGER